jgi:hypothetical protein
MITPPANIILTNKYTVEGEFVNKKTYEPYQGYYYELNNRFFAGKSFNSNSPEIVKVSSLNPNLLASSDAKLFKNLSRFNFNSIQPNAQQYTYESNARYFLSQNNITPILIKEVSKETFQQFSNNPLYNSVVLTEGGLDEGEVRQAERKMPGITVFLGSSYVPPPEDGYDGSFTIEEKITIL